MPSVQSTDTIRANADLLRRVAAAIGLTGTTLVEVCERVILDVGTGAACVRRREELTAPAGEAVRLDTPSDAVRDG